MSKEITAVYLRINNVKDQYGGMNYHGLDVNTFGSVIAGSALYSEDMSTCYMIYNATDFAIPDDPDITLSTEEEYNAIRDADLAKRPVPTDEKIKQLENMVEMLILGNGGL